MKPTNIELMKSIVSDEIGTRKFTNAGYSVLYAKIREAVIKEYAKQNADKMLEIENRKENMRLEKKEILQMQIDEARRIKEAKLEAFKIKLEEDRRRNDLKQKALEIREQELARARETKEQKAKAKVSEGEGKINHFKED